MGRNEGKLDRVRVNSPSVSEQWVGGTLKLLDSPRDEVGLYVG